MLSAAKLRPLANHPPAKNYLNVYRVNDDNKFRETGDPNYLRTKGSKAQVLGGQLNTWACADVTFEADRDEWYEAQLRAASAAFPLDWTASMAKRDAPRHGEFPSVFQDGDPTKPRHYVTIDNSVQNMPYPIVHVRSSNTQRVLFTIVREDVCKAG